MVISFPFVSICIDWQLVSNETNTCLALNGLLNRYRDGTGIRLLPIDFP